MVKMTKRGGVDPLPAEGGTAQEPRLSCTRERHAQGWLAVAPTIWKQIRIVFPRGTHTLYRECRGRSCPGGAHRVDGVPARRWDPSRPFARV